MYSFLIDRGYSCLTLNLTVFEVTYGAAREEKKHFYFIPKVIVDARPMSAGYFFLFKQLQL